MTRTLGIWSAVYFTILYFVTANVSFCRPTFPDVTSAEYFRYDRAVFDAWPVYKHNPRSLIRIIVVFFWRMLNNPYHIVRSVESGSPDANFSCRWAVSEIPSEVLKMQDGKMTDVIGLEFEGLKNAELKIGGPNEKIYRRICCIQVDYR